METFVRISCSLCRAKELKILNFFASRERKKIISANQKPAFMQNCKNKKRIREKKIQASSEREVKKDSERMDELINNPEVLAFIQQQQLLLQQQGVCESQPVEASQLEDTLSSIEFDEEIFVEELIKYLCLWDTKSSAYKDAVKKNKAWEALSLLFGKESESDIYFMILKLTVSIYNYKIEAWENMSMMCIVDTTGWAWVILLVHHSVVVVSLSVTFGLPLSSVYLQFCVVERLTIYF